MDENNNENHNEAPLNDEEVPSSSQAKKRKGRGPAKPVQSKVPMFLEFDELHLPKGKWEKEYGQQIGQCAVRLDITHREWEKVDDSIKDSMWEETKKKFHITEDLEGIRKINFLKAVGNRFRRHRSWLVTRFIKRTTAPKEGSPNANLQPWELYEGYINEDQWKQFEAYVATDEFIEKSEKGQENAKGNIYRHVTGQKGYSRKRPDWIRDKVLPAIDEGCSTLEERVKLRPREWVLAHTKPTKEGKWEANPKKPETVRMVNLVMEYLDKEAKEQEERRTTTSEPGVDALTKALEKKDHRGHVKGLGRSGVSVCHGKVFGKVNQRGTKNRCSSEELESFKAALTQEMEKKFNDSLQEQVALQVQSYLTSMSTMKMQSDVVQQPVLDRHPPSINGIKKCRLAVVDAFTDGNLVVVAEGTLYPCPTGVMHNSQNLLQDHYKVSVDKPYEEHGMIDLPVPSPDGATKLRDAKNLFLQWPCSMVLFDEKIQSQNKERVSSCDPKSEGSTCVSFEGMVGPNVVAQLTEECELLFYRMCVGKNDTMPVSLDAPLFYFPDDKEVWVTSTDISEFLRGAWANVSLIHVYILSLAHDFISVFNYKHIGFLCPQTISSAEIKRDVVEVQTYVKRAFISEVVMKLKHCKFILAPYIQDNHWILIVIDLRLGIAFVFDPDTQPKDKPRPLNIEPILHYAYKSYRSCLKGSALKGSRPNLIFNQMECAQQSGGTECGYYVMRYMYEIVAHHNDCKGNLQEDYMGRSSAYNDNEINKVREHWAKFFRTTILLK